MLSHFMDIDRGKPRQLTGAQQAIDKISQAVRFGGNNLTELSGLAMHLLPEIS